MALNRPQIIKLVLAVVLLASATIMVLARRDGGGPRGVYHYDLATGRLIASPASDRAAIRAHVYGCGDCGEQDRRVLWLSRRLDAPASAGATEDPAAGPRSTQVALPPPAGKQPVWIGLLDPRAAELSAQAATLCTGQAAAECLP